MGLGSIPWNHIMDYADRHQLGPRLTRVFARVIGAMDDAYMDWERARFKAEAEARGR